MSKNSNLPHPKDCCKRCFMPLKPVWLCKCLGGGGGGSGGSSEKQTASDTSINAETKHLKHPVDGSSPITFVTPLPLVSKDTINTKVGVDREVINSLIERHILTIECDPDKAMLTLTVNPNLVTAKESKVLENYLQNLIDIFDKYDANTPMIDRNDAGHVKVVMLSLKHFDRYEDCINELLVEGLLPIKMRLPMTDNTLGHLPVSSEEEISEYRTVPLRLLPLNYR